MTKKERIKYLNQLIIPNLFDNSQESCELRMKQETALRETIEELKQEPCEDCISRSEALSVFRPRGITEDVWKECDVYKKLTALPPVTPQKKMGKCKDCKYFEYDSVATVHGIPLIIAHEICKRWSDGCKTSEDGYCFLFEPKTQEDKE